MNTHMYSHPLTQPQLDIVKNQLGYTVYGPISKTLACGDIGSFLLSTFPFLFLQLISLRRIF